MNGNKSDVIREALQKALDVLEAAQMPFVILGDIAYQMKNQQELDAPKAFLAVEERYNIRELTSMLPIIDPKIEILTDGWKIMHKGFPVIIHIMTKKYKFLQEPDTVFYKYDMWPIPNPFNEYWESDHLDV